MTLGTLIHPYSIMYCRLSRDRVLQIGPELVQITSEKVKVIRDNLKIARDRQKSYADNRRRDL